MIVLRNGRIRSVARIVDRLWRRTAVVTFIAAIVIPTGLLIGFRIVVTSSVPKGLWYVHSGAIARGQYALLCLPKDLAEIGRRAGYLPRGSCPGGVLPLMKRVIALGGDLVAVDRDGIRVNGNLLRGSKPLRRDSHGRFIESRVAMKEEVVPAGRMWVLGDWFKSWDSRYFGGVPEDRVIGLGTPLITTPPGS